MAALDRNTSKEYVFLLSPNGFPGGRHGTNPVDCADDQGGNTNVQTRCIVGNGLTVALPNRPISTPAKSPGKGKHLVRCVVVPPKYWFLDRHRVTYPPDRCKINSKTNLLPK